MNTMLESLLSRRAAFVELANMQVKTLARVEHARRREAEAAAELSRWQARRALAEQHCSADMGELADTFIETFIEQATLWQELAQEAAQDVEEGAAMLDAVRAPYLVDVEPLRGLPDFEQFELPDPDTLPREQALRELEQRDAEIEAETRSPGLNQQLEREFFDWEASVGVCVRLPVPGVN